jgi:FdrA protein
VAVILLDVVLGYGAHSDPASELAPAIAAAIRGAKQAGRRLEVVAVVSGTDGDPQGFEAQIQRLQEAGARTELSNDAAARYVGRLLQAIEGRSHPESAPAWMPVDLGALKQPMAGLNVGLESFAASLKEQGAQAIHVDWRPSAGSNERLAGILERMRQGT